MDGLDNTKLNHREVRMRAKPRSYVESEEDDSIGWFRKINQHTHYLYAAYPCLVVYAIRIIADMSFIIDEGLDPVWQLPPDIRPDDANVGNATSNLLGFKPANKLTPLQMQWLIESGFNDEAGYVSTHPTISNHSIASRANDSGTNGTHRD